MLYPRLPLVMFAEIKARRLAFLYGSVRRRELARTHTRIGFTSAGTLPVLVKPLRPARLVARMNGWNRVAATVAPIDAVWALGLAMTRPRIPPGLAVAPPGPDPLDPEVLEFVRATIARAREPVRRAWTVDALRDRYRQTREGTAYTLLGVTRAATLVAVLAFRIGERGAGIRAGVIMDAVAAPGEARTLLPALLLAEQHAHRAGCDAMMFLSGLGPEVDRVFRSCGYHGSSEQYEMLVWPKDAPSATPELARAENWRFTFADHDAF
jgi:hypothetical protein